jgi:four helix bundle protein
MTKTSSHRDLEVWKRGIELALEARTLARGFPRDERYRLEDQLCRSARSVPANISEGFGRFTRPELRKYLGYALGEAAEVDTHLEIAIRSGFCTEPEGRALQDAYSQLGWMIRRFKSSIPGPG